MKSKVPVHIFPISIDLQNKVTPQNLQPNQKDPDKKKTHTLIGLVILGIKIQTSHGLKLTILPIAWRNHNGILDISHQRGARSELADPFFLKPT